MGKTGRKIGTHNEGDQGVLAGPSREKEYQIVIQST